jgi:ChpA-C
LCLQSLLIVTEVGSPGILVDERSTHVKMRTRIAGVPVATAAGVAVMGAPAFAQSSPFGILSGNTVNVPVQVPVNACGIAAGILGFADAGCQGGAAAGIWDSFNGWSAAPPV